MFLVDTSVWIGYLRRRRTLPVRWLEEILDRDYPFGITELIYQEVLQGADSEASFERLREYFGSQRFYLPEDPLASAEGAAHLYFRCRRAGITIRSTVDCRIARTAVEHDLLLVHDDRDFDFIATVEPELRIYSGSLSTPTSSEIHEPAARYDA